jgi:hypothetical protein
MPSSCATPIAIEAIKAVAISTSISVNPRWVFFGTCYRPATVQQKRQDWRDAESTKELAELLDV